MAKNLLTALQVKEAKPKEKEYLLGDGGNLFVRIRPNGSKYFEVIVRINSKKRRISLGDATIISLEQARKLCEKELIRLKALIYFKLFIEYFGKMEVGKINKRDIVKSANPFIIFNIFLQVFKDTFYYNYLNEKCI